MLFLTIIVYVWPKANIDSLSSTIKVGQTYSIAVSAPVLAPPITSALVLSAGTSKKVVPLTSGQKIDIQFKCIMPGEQKISASWNGFSDSIAISCVR
ncbi:MAG: hypothetical protein QXV64_00125 [Candidatus Anstonellaceae archaeon]